MLAPTPRDLLEQATQAAYRATWSPSRGHSPEARQAAQQAAAAILHELGKHILTRYIADSGQNPFIVARTLNAPALAAPEVLLAARLLNAAKIAGQYAITHRRAP
ncbi:hypothetical protein [Saccharomonospora viridis]|uniref:hypothetical protein n=1 Tax=Saccharomonospora viridis TaxID=1852 RepID=UPI00240A0E85|nr:hypothetical protein [Saccharomonospora viridis]